MIIRDFDVNRDGDQQWRETYAMPGRRSHLNRLVI
jgi:hypothetical protein